MKILLLCGPPGAGKDLIGRELQVLLPGLPMLLKFAQPIVDFLFRNYGIQMEMDGKDSPHRKLHGKTPRQVAIAYSEKFCKPLFGIDYFGRLALAEVERLQSFGAETVILTDSGFVHEAAVLLQHYGPQNIRVVHISRPGKSFEGDSRSHWSHPDIGEILFENPGDTKGSLHADLLTGLIPQLRTWLSS